MEWVQGAYKISNNKVLLCLEEICELLAQSYWANKRPRAVIERAIENSLCYGVYNEDKQVGFARVITDYATNFYICDVIIDEKHRGRGLGKKLIQCIVETEELQGIFGMLLTKDAHGLYEKYGFVKGEGMFRVKMRKNEA